MIAKYKMLLNLMQEFGVLRTFLWQLKKKLLKKQYDKDIITYLENDNREIIEKYQTVCDYSIDINNPKKIIWIFWWQGINAMPEIVKSCFASVLENAVDYKVVLLTCENYKEYVTLPDIILTKFAEKKISITHFSDCLRMQVLGSLGGLWLDATILVTNNLPAEIANNPFYTRRIKEDTPFVSNGKWSGYFISASQGNIMFKMVNEIFYNYWLKHNALIDYLFIDYAIMVCYKNIPQIRKMIEAVPYNNGNIHIFFSKLNNPYESKEYNDICNNSYLHKLSYKQRFILKIDEKDTFYKYIIERYRLKNLRRKNL